jgi:hypothetical protein
MSTNPLGLLEAFDEHIEDFTESKKKKKTSTVIFQHDLEK